MSITEKIKEELDELLAERADLRDKIDGDTQRLADVEVEIGRLSRALEILTGPSTPEVPVEQDKPAKGRAAAAEATAKVTIYLDQEKSPKTVKEISEGTGLSRASVAKVLLDEDAFPEVTGQKRNTRYTTKAVAEKVVGALEKIAPMLEEQMKAQVEEQEAIRRAMEGDHARDHDGFAASEEYDPAPPREDYDIVPPEVEKKDTVFVLEDDDDDNTDGFKLTV